MTPIPNTTVFPWPIEAATNLLDAAQQLALLIIIWIG